MRLPDVPCAVIFDPPGSAAWNMAVDEALLQRAATRNLAALRFYRWLEPTVSLGYFQHASQLAECDRLAALPTVRRMSGGGALLHDREITYSLALPARRPTAQSPDDLYRAVHQVWIDQFSTCGVPAQLWESTVSHTADRAPDGEQPLLCFERRSPFDVVAIDRRAATLRRDVKLVGSAHR